MFNQVKDSLTCDFNQIQAVLLILDGWLCWSADSDNDNQKIKILNNESL